ncbi:Pr6Pr family membrane protein [Actinomycetospora flava]|uniref:Pr6Pr family membrane protein n=1 Tax=Actinomycetospora flava TaxID=3129232 RepID=A0ABU8MBQ8_9PSEU
MTATDTPPTSPPRRAGTASRVWHLLIAVDVAAALVIQVGLILTGGPDPNTGEAVASVGIGTRVIQTLSYFTIQSNILVLIAAITLVVDPARDGRIWRILRLDALLGITITGLVFDLVLIRYVHPTGWQLAATIGFHYIAPWATLLGWLLFGPRPRIDRSTVAWAFLWPMLWIAYTFIRGALVGWYPYPFLDVDEIGYWASIRNTAFVLVVAVVLVAVFAGLDRFRTIGSAPRRDHGADGPRSAAASARP